MEDRKPNLKIEAKGLAALPRVTRHLSNPHLKVKAGFFGIFFDNFSNQISQYALKVYQKIFSKIAHFFHPSAFQKKSVVCLFFFFLVQCVFFPLAATHYSLSAVLIFRNEAPYLKEWIEFHRLVGVEHFYLCSHNSTDNYLEVLQPYLDQKIVELEEVHDADHESQVSFNDLQLGFYNRCLAKGKSSSDWMAFIDSDEFLFPTTSSSLVKVLSKYRNYGGVAVNWRLFGTSRIAELDKDKPLIEQLTLAAPIDCQGCLTVKCVVQPKKVDGFHETPHSPDFKPHCYQVNSDRVPFHGPFSPYLQLDTIRINHYWTRDEHYFYNYKVPRQTQWLGFTRENVEHIPELYNQELDETIQRFVPKLKKKMMLKPPF